MNRLAKHISGKRVLRYLYLAFTFCASGLSPDVVTADAHKDLRKSHVAHSETPAVRTYTHAEIHARWQTLPAERKVIVLNQLIAQNQLDFAEQLMASTNFQGGSQKDIQYLRAVLEKKRGRHNQAAGAFRALLAEHPENQRVRIDLAHTLFLMEEDDSARYHFNLAMAASQDQKLITTIRSFIDRMDKRRRWQFAAYLSLAPSTNFNQGTDEDLIYINGIPFHISDGSKRRSGVGLNAGLTGGYRFEVTDDIDFVTGFGTNFKHYPNEIYDDLVTSIEAGPRYNFERGHVSVLATGNQRWFSGKKYSTAIGLRTSAQVRLGKSTISTVNSGCETKTYDIAVHLNGYACHLHVAADHYLNNLSYVRALGGGRTERTDREHLDFAAWYAGLGIYRELSWGLSVYGQVRYERRDYDGLFPGHQYARDDDRFDLSTTFTKRDWNAFGFAPQVTYTYTRNFSNVVFYDYDAHAANLTLTKNF